MKLSMLIECDNNCSNCVTENCKDRKHISKKETQTKTKMKQRIINTQPLKANNFKEFV